MNSPPLDELDFAYEVEIWPKADYLHKLIHEENLEKDITALLAHYVPNLEIVEIWREILPESYPKVLIHKKTIMEEDYSGSIGVFYRGDLDHYQLANLLQNTPNIEKVEAHGWPIPAGK